MVAVEPPAVARAVAPKMLTAVQGERRHPQADAHRLTAKKAFVADELGVFVSIDQRLTRWRG